MFKKFILSFLIVVFVTISFANSANARNTIVPRFNNCSISVTNNLNYLTISQYASMNNIKSLSVDTKVYADGVLIYNNTSYSSFAGNNGFTGAYNFSYYPKIKSDTRNIMIKNSIYYLGADNINRTKTCNKNLRLY